MIGVCVYRKDVTLNADFTDAAREQMTVLPARVENCNAIHGRII